MPGAGLERLISTVNEGGEMGSLKVVLVLLRAMLIPKVHLAVENLALRQQLAVCKQSVKRPKLRLRDRVFWVLLSRLWSNWQSALAIAVPRQLFAAILERIGRLAMQPAVCASG